MYNRSSLVALSESQHDDHIQVHEAAVCKYIYIDILSICYCYYPIIVHTLFRNICSNKLLYTDLYVNQTKTQIVFYKNIYYISIEGIIQK